MLYTRNYNLKKPELMDIYNVEDFNDNAESIDAALQDLKAKTGSLSLSTTNWTTLSPAMGEYKYKYVYELAGVTDTDVCNGSVSLDSEGYATDCGLAQRCETGANTITFYAKDVPSNTIVIDYNITRGV